MATNTAIQKGASLRARSRSSTSHLPAFLVRGAPVPARRASSEEQQQRVDIPPERFGDRVLARRRELRISQSALVQQVNSLLGIQLGRTSVSVWENGHAEPSLRTIRGVARVLATRPEYLAFGVRCGGPDREMQLTHEHASRRRH